MAQYRIINNTLAELLNTGYLTFTELSEVKDINCAGEKNFKSDYLFRDCEIVTYQNALQGDEIET